MSDKSKPSGFSLIEILVSIAIIITETTVIVAILSSSFRGISKSNAREEVRQNGNHAIGRMSKLIQFAEGFIGASEDYIAYDSSCTLSRGKWYKVIRIRSNGEVVGLRCDNLSIRGSPLIDTSKVKVEPGSCRFTCFQDEETTPPIIGISFELSEAADSVFEKKTKIYFSTTVKMRNR